MDKLFNENLINLGLLEFEKTSSCYTSIVHKTCFSVSSPGNNGALSWEDTLPGLREAASSRTTFTATSRPTDSGKQSKTLLLSTPASIGCCKEAHSEYIVAHNQWVRRFLSTKNHKVLWNSLSLVILNVQDRLTLGLQCVVQAIQERKVKR